MRSRLLSMIDCQYTCHNKCRPGVTLDCASVSAEEKEPSESETALNGHHDDQQKVVRLAGTDLHSITNEFIAWIQLSLYFKSINYP